METHDIQQGSPAWHKFRAEHFGASEAAAMLGLSPYKTRSELLHEKVTGITKEVNAGTQVIFDRGHETESACRPLIEVIIGDELSPVTLSDGSLSCSCDGLNFDGNIAWEHKQFNAKLFASIMDKVLPEEFQPQCQQILMITGAERLMFTCSDGTPDRCASMWVLPDTTWFTRIRAGWAQFTLDLSSYSAPEVIQAAVATPTMGLPAVTIQVNGEISLIDNLSIFGEKLKEFVGAINKTPDNDQGFADAEAAIKTLEKAQEALEAAESGALAQVATVDEMRRTVALYVELARTTRLSLTKIVKERKDELRLKAIRSGQDALADHILTLNKRLGKVQMPPVSSDFPGVIKGLKKLDSLRNEIDTELARCKIEANAIADRIEINLNTLAEKGKDCMFLFHDFAQLVSKPNGDFMDTVNARISAHKEAEREREEAHRVAHEKQMETERERIRTEEQARAQEAERQKQAAVVPEVPAPTTTAPPATQPRPSSAAVQPDKVTAFMQTRQFSKKEYPMVREILEAFVKFCDEPF